MSAWADRGWVKLRRGGYVSQDGQWRVVAGVGGWRTCRRTRGVWVVQSLAPTSSEALLSATRLARSGQLDTDQAVS